MMMRTCVLVIVAALVLGLARTPQAGTRLEVGPKAGLVFTTVGGEEANELAPTAPEHPGYLVRGHVGAVVALVLNDMLSVQTEFAYAQRGAEWEKTITRNDTSSTATQTVDVNYFEIPLLLKLTIPTSGKFQPYLAAGPAVAFNTSSSAKIVLETFTGGRKLGQVDVYADNIENVKGTVFKIVAAGGCALKLGEKHKLLLEGRYIRSFGDTFEDVADVEDVPEDKAIITDEVTGKALDVQLSAFSILVGYSFGFDL